MSKEKIVSDEELFLRASRFNSRGDLRKYDNRAYQGLHRRGLLTEACINMEPSLTEAYTIDEISAVAKNHATKMSFRKHNQGMYDVAYKRGWLPIVCSHMPDNASQSGENHPGFKWSFDVVSEIAKKYDYKIDFLKNDPNAYAAAYVKGWLEKICSHMKDSYHQWTKEEVSNLALRCKTRVDFQENYYQAYQYSRKIGQDFLNEICSHMKPCRGSSRAERLIYDMVKSFFDDAKKYRDHKVLIPDHPCIGRLEIDVLVPSLKKGIEFDGNESHSISGLKRGRSKWSDEAIVNYHKIKDDYFLSKNIILLHITEKEWSLDKEICIKRIKDFLGIEV